MQQNRQLETELHDLIEKNSQLRVNGEKASREHRSLKESLERSKLHYEEEKRATEAAFKTLEDKITQTINSREEEIRQKHYIQEQNSELRNTIDSLRLQVIIYLLFFFSK